MRIDAHQHYWRYNPEEFGWIDESMRAIRRDFLPADFAAEASGMDGAVAVQARQSMAETLWLLELARQNPLIKAVVGWVPLAHSGLRDAFESVADDPLLKGVRHVVQAEADPGFLEGEAFNAGIRSVTRRGLVYDILIFAHQLSGAIAFVDRHPGQVFVLDHIAKPVIRGAPAPAWHREIVESARRENVYCKFSGVVTEVPGWEWSPSTIRPYFEAVVEAFGPRRLMFGSDWPVCLVATDYARWLECVETLASGLSPTERALLFGDTAAKVYNIAQGRPQA